VNKVPVAWPCCMVNGNVRVSVTE